LIVSMAYPTVYMQETDLLQQCGSIIHRFGKRLFVISGKTAWEKAGASLSQALQDSSIHYTLEFFRGTCTYEEARRLQSLIPEGTDLIVAVGGGQCMDTVKLMAVRTKIPVATVPTLASTCAATTPLSVMYDEQHKFVDVEYYDQCPALTLVDTRIISNAPPQYLVAGIGDTLAKWYEAYPINAGKKWDARTRLALHIAELAKDMLFEFGEQAIAENRAGEPGESLRQIVDVNLLYAGLVGGIGHYTCRGSGAHSFHNGLTSLEGIGHSLHGEIVAFCILCQLMLEQKPDEIEHLADFYIRVGLPLSLHDLHVQQIHRDELMQSVRLTCDLKQDIHHLPFPIIEEEVFEAIMKTHDWGCIVRDQSD
jgi:glycerol dehydrogenase-like iron-containing ADH family enzyme